MPARSVSQAPLSFGALLVFESRFESLSKA